MTFTDEQVERAAEAIAREDLSDFAFRGYEGEEYEEAEEQYRQMARAALESVEQPEPLTEDWPVTDTRIHLDAEIVQEIHEWAEFFSPYVKDDNDWYRGGNRMDGKDAAEIGHLFNLIRKAIAAAKESE